MGVTCPNCHSADLQSTWTQQYSQRHSRAHCNRCNSNFRIVKIGIWDHIADAINGLFKK